MSIVLFVQNGNLCLPGHFYPSSAGAIFTRPLSRTPFKISCKIINYKLLEIRQKSIRDSYSSIEPTIVLVNLFLSPLLPSRFLRKIGSLPFVTIAIQHDTSAIVRRTTKLIDHDPFKEEQFHSTITRKNSLTFSRRSRCQFHQRFMRAFFVQN